MATITVEDGTIVANANSYISVAYLDSYCSDRGITLATVDHSSLVVTAMDYIETLMYQGERTDILTPQALQWPRKDVIVNENELVDKNTIPTNLKKAVAEMCVAIDSGYNPDQTLDASQFISSEQFGVFQATYANGAPLTPILTKFDRYISPLLYNGDNSGIHMTVVRSYG